MENENLLARIAKLRSNEQFPTRAESDGSKHQINVDRMERAIIRRMEFEERYLATIEANHAEMMEIETAIDSLKDPLEREVLRMRYTDSDTIRKRKWHEIAVDIYGGDDEKHMQAVNRLHRRAIANIAEL